MRIIPWFRNKSITDNLLSSKGMTLIEVLVAISVMGVASLALVRLNQSMNRTGKNMNQQMDALQLTYKINQNLRTTSACTNSFAGNVIVNGGPASNIIRDTTGNIVNQVNDKYGNITITGFEFVNVQPAAGLPYTITNPANGLPVTVRTRMAAVRMNLKKGTSAIDSVNKQTTMGTLNFSKHFELKFQVLDDASDNIVVTCDGGDSQSLEVVCDSLDGFLQAGKCKNIQIYNRAGALNAAVFNGNVVIQPSFGAGTFWALGNVNLGNDAADVTTVTGRLCFNGQCISNWNTHYDPATCSQDVTGIRNVFEGFSMNCNAGKVATGVSKVDLGGGFAMWVINCCRVKVK
jgi:prepilin-type N-terminal cleavage/methylation domain-containing protein